MSGENKDNEVIVTLHGKEVLKLDQKGDITFQGNFVANDLEANKRFLAFFQSNITRIIEGDKAADEELDNAPDACATCSGC
jgi:hypothetical protein